MPCSPVTPVLRALVWDLRPLLDVGELECNRFEIVALPRTVSSSSVSVPAKQVVVGSEQAFHIPPIPGQVVMQSRLVRSLLSGQDLLDLTILFMIRTPYTGMTCTSSPQVL